ncbi:hypothetical protein PIB30_051848 [Stylosanthes scabra]|uniref:Putative plant transposon protein domain-containing protein n=1 Tax=Stylosanthes scabra TaxID=79078 RepID=A0ABU6ZGT9_9FABA|nr:hypothetical protein [Stylosanthes scabra]
MAKGWYDFVCRSIMPTTNCSELTVERAVLIHSIIIGENINVEEIIAEQFYMFIYKTDLSSSLPFPSIIAALCLDAKVVPHKDDTMIPQEIPIVGEAMVRTRETRARQPRQPRQEVPPPQQPPQVHQQHELPPSFYTHFDASMSQIYRRLDQQQEENRKSFEAINTRMDRMDDQLSFLCYSNQMSNETMYYPYQNTARQFRDMEAQAVEELDSTEQVGHEVLERDIAYCLVEQIPHYLRGFCCELPACCSIVTGVSGCPSLIFFSIAAISDKDFIRNVDSDSVTSCMSLLFALVLKC